MERINPKIAIKFNEKLRHKLPPTDTMRARQIKTRFWNGTRAIWVCKHTIESELWDNMGFYWDGTVM